MYKKTLVCLDGSHLAEQIVPHAAEVARCCGSRIVLLEITVPPGALIEPLTGYFHATPLDKILREEKEARTYLNRLARQLRKMGIKVSCVTMPGDPGEVIVNYTNENNIDLVALSTHGRSGLGRLAFGSVTDYVLKRVQVPVLLRRPAEPKE